MLDVWLLISFFNNDFLLGAHRSMSELNGGRVEMMLFWSGILAEFSQGEERKKHQYFYSLLGRERIRQVPRKSKMRVFFFFSFWLLDHRLPPWLNFLMRSKVAWFSLNDWRPTTLNLVLWIQHKYWMELSFSVKNGPPLLFRTSLKLEKLF